MAGVDWLSPDVPGEATLGAESEDTPCEMMIISGVVFDDVNGNGNSEENDRSLSDFVIELDINSDGTVDESTSTSRFGRYEFQVCVDDENLNFTVRQNLTHHPNWIQTSFPIPPQPIQSRPSRDNHFGNFELGRIKGYFYDDINDNQRDDQEPRLKDVPIVLRRDRDDDGDVDETTPANTETVDGSFSFWNLGPGRYVVGELIEGGVLSNDRTFLITSGSLIDAPVGIYFPPPPPWQNPVDAHDVDESGTVFPRDVLLVINELNNRKFSVATTGKLGDRISRQDFFYDVNGDGHVTPLDALIVINHLNTNGEGESAAVRTLVLPANIGVMSQPEKETLASRIRRRQVTVCPYATG